jgi:hypothetical protein
MVLGLEREKVSVEANPWAIPLYQVNVGAVFGGDKLNDSVEKALSCERFFMGWNRR